MKQRSAGKMLETWRWMENRQVCVWIDNCYIKQYGTHPTIQDQSQNCAALCVVEIPCRLPYFRGHPNIDVLIGGIGSVAAALVRMKRSFHGIVTDLGLQRTDLQQYPALGRPLTSCEILNTESWLETAAAEYASGFLVQGPGRGVGLHSIPVEPRAPHCAHPR